MKKWITLCSLPFLLGLLAIFSTHSAFSFQTDENSRPLQFSKSVEYTISSKFGDCPIYFRKSCGETLRLICNRPIDNMRTSRTGYYLDFDLNPVAPSCNWFNQKDCQEPTAWNICEKVRKYQGIAPSSEMERSVQNKFGSGDGYTCKVVSTCGDMLYVDCGAAADGPAYLLDRELNMLAPSGGLCMAGCAGHDDQWKKWDNCREQANKDLRKKLETGEDVPPSSLMSDF